MGFSASFAAKFKIKRKQKIAFHPHGKSEGLFGAVLVNGF